MLIDDFARLLARETLFRPSSPSWSARILGLQLDPWQVKQVSASPGSRVICLVHRQAGKTTEYLNEFDSLESRFFSPDAIAAAFGGVIGPTPAEQIDDPVLVRSPVFNKRKLFA